MWQRLLAEPSPRLEEALSDAVEKKTGVPPDRGLVAAFLREQAEAAPIEEGQDRPAPSGPLPAPAPSRGGGPFSFSFAGETRSFRYAKDLLVAVFRKLAARDPGFCERYAGRYYGTKRRYLATRREDLFPDTPERIAIGAVSVASGWWLGTHMGNSQKVLRIREACEVAGLRFEEDLVVDFPIRPRRRRGGRS